MKSDDSFPLYVYLDTSIFIKYNFDIYHPNFKTIVDAAKNGEVKVFWNSILEGEFLSNCRKRINDSLGDLKKFGEVNTLKKNIFKKWIDYDPEKLSSNVLEKFKKELRVENIDCNIDYREVFKDYFELNTPFSNKKKDQFPDAFVIKMLL